MPNNVVSHEEWVTARKALLAKEKDLTRARDALSAEIRELPMEEVSKTYSFTATTTTTDETNQTSQGSKLTLSDLFRGRKQLIVYHFMFSPEAEQGCVGCSFFEDHIPHLSHLNATQTSFVLISRAPPPKLAAFRERMGWTDVPWYSSFESDFNYDFQATQDEAVREPEYNYMDKAALQRKGFDDATRGEQPGLSVFLKGDDGKVYHTYSAYARGTDHLLMTNSLLDLTPLGRQAHVSTFKHHDKY